MGISDRFRMNFRISTLVLFILACIILTLPNSNGIAASVTNISTYTPDTTLLRKNDIVKSSREIGSPSGISARSDKVGNVIFNDNFAFGGSSVTTDNGEGNKRKYAPVITEEQSWKDHSSASPAGGFLQNHRLEGPLSPEIVKSAAIAASASTNINEGNDLKFSSDSSYNIHLPNGVTGAGASVVGHGHGRSYNIPNQQYGWASNPGSCLFSCSSGSFGAADAVSCCQLNYIQCCPNPRQEQWNFKNLHHGRGHLGAGGLGGIIGKGGGYGWGSLPYNPPPIIRQRPCYPYQPTPGIINQPIPAQVYGGGSIFHKGIESIKHNFHNIGQFFKEAGGGGWGSGGNGAAGYYFHRRSDSPFPVDGTANHNHGEAPSNKKRRLARSLNKGFDSAQVLPCPLPVVPNYGWGINRPQSVGLGSLIGWTRPPVNHIHGGFIGGGAHAFPHGHGNFGGGNGWGVGLHGSPHCRWDHECSGNLKCCKGICQIEPHLG